MFQEYLWVKNTDYSAVKLKRGASTKVLNKSGWFDPKLRKICRDSSINFKIVYLKSAAMLLLS